MGNRFAGLPEYHVLIRAHGIIAAITFLLIVPSAIFIARFYWRDTRLALRLHIYLQILTVFLATVILILGWFAVGPDRSLTNPHHGIGVAIYTLVLVQFIGGALIHRSKNLDPRRIPLRHIVRTCVSLTYTPNTDAGIVASSMARADNCPPGYHPDRSGSDTLRLAENTFHPLFPCSICMDLTMVHTDLRMDGTCRRLFRLWDG